MIRLFDFIFSTVGLLMMWPIGLILYIIGLFDTGKPIFIQERVGKHKKPFNLYKFRTMDVSTKSVASHLASQSSITKFGGFLRKTKLDELPQLFSLLTGKMSLIGYRPSQKSEKELNDEREYLNLHQIRPGITGWAQVNGRDILAANPTLKAKYDGYYLSKISIFLDIKIFFMTIKKVLFNKDIKDGTIDNNIDNHQST